MYTSTLTLMSSCKSLKGFLKGMLVCSVFSCRSTVRALLDCWPRLMEPWRVAQTMTVSRYKIHRNETNHVCEARELSFIYPRTVIPELNVIFDRMKQKLHRKVFIFYFLLRTDRQRQHDLRLWKQDSQQGKLIKQIQFWT